MVGYELLTLAKTLDEKMVAPPPCGLVCTPAITGHVTEPWVWTPLAALKFALAMLYFLGTAVGDSGDRTFVPAPGALACAPVTVVLAVAPTLPSTRLASPANASAVAVFRRDHRIEFIALPQESQMDAFNGMPPARRSLHVARILAIGMPPL